MTEKYYPTTPVDFQRDYRLEKTQERLTFLKSSLKNLQDHDVGGIATMRSIREVKQRIFDCELEIRTYKRA